MIDKVSVDNGYQYLEHGRQGKNQALQSYENTFGAKETQERKQEKAKKQASAAAPSQDKTGVILDISAGAAKEKERTAQKGLTSDSWQELVQKLVSPAKRLIQMLKDFWHSDSSDINLPSLEEDEPHPAHNSDLLTYYDRRGKLVEMDESSKHRVLFGDKHVLKL